MRTLIIDDDPVTRFYFEEVLGPHGKTEAAASGEEGLEAFSRAMSQGRPFDAVLVDIRMPGMDGHQTVQKLRAAEQEAGVKTDGQTAVLMISAMDDARNVNRAFFQGGAVSYLTKPVDPDTLLEELRKFGLLR
ncbi:MAG: response regulator [Thermodesulfobacteriota bacterium]